MAHNLIPQQTHAHLPHHQQEQVRHQSVYIFNIVHRLNVDLIKNDGGLHFIDDWSPHFWYGYS